MITLKRGFYFLIGVFSVMASSLAWAGGVQCAPNYCIDSDANGCHPCEFFEEQKIQPDGAICCSETDAPKDWDKDSPKNGNDEQRNCVSTC